jgi:protein SCO1
MSSAARPLVIATAFASSLVVGLLVLFWAMGGVSKVVQPAAVGGPFQLTDQNGKAVTDASLKGKPTLIFFGYTHCPDVCPTTMAELSQALQQLGPEDAKRVQVLFVTVDPERDTPQLLAQYVPAFNPSFVGLRPANEEQLAKLAKDFRVYYAKVPGKTPDSYTMDHTAASYVFDTDGKLRLFARDGQGATPWVHDIKLLLD